MDDDNYKEDDDLYKDDLGFDDFGYGGGQPPIEKHSDLLKELTEHGLLKHFERICVDRNQNINLKLPSFLKEVPTIIVPDYDQPLVGIDAFKWIKWKLKQMNQESGKLNPYEDNAFSNSYSSLSDNVISTDDKDNNVIQECCHQCAQDLIDENIES
ncbi:MAG: hypothetical protein IID03_09345 [Candidatus Dadabacteria bacterium]|nr:hypothetical protein [Candidatus Dadabacteria bacterium]